MIVDILRERKPASYDLFLRSLRCQHTLVISSWALRELARIGYEQQCDTIMRLLGANKKIIFVSKTPEDELVAERAPTYFADAVHYAIAKRSADGIATWNTRDFPFTDILVGTPREL